jgi:hypothetical protein
VGKKRDRERREDRGRRDDRGDRDRDDLERRRGPQAKDICFNCGKSGHW